MKRTVCPSPARNRWLAAYATFMACATIATATASTRPKMGGTLRVEISDRLTTIDPREWPSDSIAAASAERVDSLVFDRLVRPDEHGTLQPALAVSWEHDAQAKRWQFRVREGVKFSDGALLTPTVAALALQQLLGVSFDVSANSDSVVVLAERPLPNLAVELSAGRYYIFHTADDNSITGTGPFRVAEWPAGDGASKAVLVANETCWAGRPFVDKIELLMGVDPQQQANALSFGQADVVELPASQVRRAAQRGIRTASSDPAELLALVCDTSRAAVQEPRVRQAISLAIDRASIADVVMQKQGVAAGALLPNWISGYAHLFPPSFSLARAKDLLAASGREPSRRVPLVLVYDSGDAEARGVADRVAVNLREAGIMVQVSGQSAGGTGKPVAADLRLVRHRLAAPVPAATLSELLGFLGEAETSLETLEQVYAAERAPIDAYRVIPLAHVTESFGLSSQVRDWMPPRWGGWRLEDVWLGPPAATGENPQ
jgi:peptide/nickel transport system substrate-binding protein